MSYLRSKGAVPALPRQRSAWPQEHSFSEFVDWFTFQAHQYGVQGTPSRLDGTVGFAGYVDRVHRLNPVISAAAVSRALLMSQWRPMWRNGTGRMYRVGLDLLERPGSMTRAQFFHLVEMHCQYAGTAYPVVSGGRLRLLDPTFVTTVLGSNRTPIGGMDAVPSDAEVLGLIYEPEGPNGQKGPQEFFAPGEFTIVAPEPDPIHWWRGVSWVSSLLSEVTIDRQVSEHQIKFFERGTVPGLIFMLDPSKTPEQARQFKEVFDAQHAGVGNQYRNVFLGGGTDVKVVGTSLDGLALNDVSGGFEARVAARSMVPAVILNIREGMQGSSLNSGNYAQTRRQWADKWFTPTADLYAEAFELLMRRRPEGAELSWDRKRVTFLQEDEQDAAQIRQTNAVTLRQLVEAGYTPDSATEYLLTDDPAVLEHTGVFSVQLQPPGSGEGSTDEGAA